MGKYIGVVLMVFLLAKTITAQRKNRCLTPNNENGVCISYDKCEKLNNFLINRRHENVIRIFLQKSFCGYDYSTGSGLPKLCCPLEKKFGQGRNQPTSKIDSSNKFLLSSILPSMCGKIMIKNNDRIIGGRLAKLGAWPWMVAIGYKSREQKNHEIQFNCGGSLITNRHVLTAAHCLVNIKRLKPFVARLGDLDLDPNKYDGATPIDILIDRVTIHEKYLYDSKNINDIALIILKDKVNFNDNIQPICLPSKSDVQINYNKISVVAGWGSTGPSEKFGQFYPQNTKLMEVELPLVDNMKCKTAYAMEKSALIDNTVICAGYIKGDEDSCQGDSGGPLMLVKPPLYYVMGIVSYGPKSCGNSNFPGVYTRVPSFIDWIHANLVQK